MTFEIVKTERLSLRKINPEVYEYVYNHCSDPELMDFFALDSLQSLEKEKEKFRNGLAMFNKTFRWFHLLDDNGKTIGWCGYHTWFPDHARAEIGYGLFDDARKGKGLMSEALRAVIAYGFSEMKLHRIEALIATYNIPSLKLVEKYGFIKEGILREHYFVDGIAEDSVMFSLLKDEFKP